MSLKGVIFDMDGVLVATEVWHYQAWKKLTDRLGIPFTQEDYDPLRGLSRSVSMDRILQANGVAASEEEKKAWAEEKNQTYLQMVDSLSEKDLSGDARYTLDRLKEAGYRLAVGSSSTHAPFVLKRLGIYDFFDAVVDGTQLTQAKPAPEVFLKAAERIGLRPGECLVVEDAHAGVEAAFRGGFRCAALGDAKNDPKAKWHMEGIRDVLRAVVPFDE